MLILRAIGPLIIQQDQARASIFDLFPDPMYCIQPIQICAVYSFCLITIRLAI